MIRSHIDKIDTLFIRKAHKKMHVLKVKMHVAIFILK